VSEAKAQLSKVIDEAELQGPQMITRRGCPAVVLVSINEWERKGKRVGTLAESFSSSPLRKSGLLFKRSPEQPRGIKL
jgi:prevent-host-death family protein